MSAPFSTAIVHDADGWHRYTRPLGALVAREVNEVVALLETVERRVEADGIFAVGYLTYEAAPAFDSAFTVHPGGDLPLAMFTFYQAREPCSVSGGNQPVVWSTTEARDRYDAAFAALKQSIGAGDVYQVNYTSRLAAHVTDPMALMTALAAGAAYGAYLEMAEATIVSASPELFFELDGTALTCKPMKGTWPRGRDRAEDARHAERLRLSEKNRAENLMITDMVRNDLGRLAQPGSVKVPSLFDVTPYPRVWQMTSSVTAATAAGLAEIFAALFPGASITGAPKHASMQLIRQLETTPRGIYTGAIGVVAPGRRYRFNIAIRTALVSKADGAAVYGVGGGIVWDSDVDEEYAELLSKGPGSAQDFALLETMRAEDGNVFLLDRHLERLAGSAAYFGFAYDEARVRKVIEESVAELPPSRHRLRLTMTMQGEVDLVASPLAPDPPQQPVALAVTPVDTADRFLYHKTTHRRVYEQAAAEVPVGCEALLKNRLGCVTESAIANVVYALDGVLYTPPIEDGVLAGTLRSELLQEGVVRERSLPVEELGQITELYLINALRGWRRATLVDHAAAMGEGSR